MSSARAAQTLQFVSAALNSGRVASMPELVRIIRTISQDENAVSVAELAELIEQDSTVLVKVISAANTLGYNPSGVRITTVSQGIQILGFARVRRLAMSLLLLEHAGRATTPAEQREMAALSLCSGLVAQVAAEHMALVDPEQAFVCASLRNFGRLVLGTFMSTEFAEARELAEREGDDDEAFRSVFGLTPLELGYELLHSAALPEPILNAIRDLPPQSLDGSAWSERRLVHVTKFALQLSELVLNPKHDPGQFATAASELVRRYGSELPTLGDLYPDLLAQAEARLTKIARSAGGAALDRYGLDRLRRRVKGHDLPARIPALIASAAGGVAPRSGSAQPAAASIEDACDLLTREGSRRDALQIALGAMRASLAPSDAFYCAFDASRGDFRLSHGHGPTAERIQGEILFRRHERNVFLLCHERLENIVVRDANDPKLQPYLPPWLRTASAPKSFVLLPVHHQSRIHGIMLVGWADAQPIQLPAERLALIRKLLALVARAAA